MPTSSRLAAHRAVAPKFNAAAEAEPKPNQMLDEDEMSEDGEEEEEEYMTEDQATAAAAAARAEGFAEANARASAVIGSEHYAGREALAANLLGNAKLGAEEIVAALQSAPQASAGSDDDADRKAMREHLAKDQPALTGQSDDSEPNATEDWADIHAEVAKDRGISAN